MGVAVYYVVLGLDPHASDEAIQHAYRRLALEYWSRGDRTTTLAVRRFRAVEEAYSVLGDPVRRADYDARIGARMDRAPLPVATDGPVQNALPASTAGMVSDLPAAMPALALPGRARPRSWPTVVIAALLAVVMLGLAGGSHRATPGGIVGAGGRQTAASVHAPTRGAMPTAGGPSVAALTGPGPAVRRLGGADTRRAVFLTTRATPDRRVTRRTVSRAAAPGATDSPQPRPRARLVVRRVGTRMPSGGRPPGRRHQNAPARHSQAPPRAAWLAPGDDALPARPPMGHARRQSQRRMAPPGSLWHGKRAWMAAHGRRGVHQAGEWRRPRYAADHEIATAFQPAHRWRRGARA